MPVPCHVVHHGMARPQVADGEDGLQIWRVAANMLNMQSRKADSLQLVELGGGLITPTIKTNVFFFPRNIAHSHEK
jgi:hypothetical protein